MTTKKDYNSIANQHIKGLLVAREVYHCQTSVVEELLNIEENENTVFELENYWYYRLDLSDGEFIGNYVDLQEKIEEVENKRDNLGALQADGAQDLEDQITVLEDDLSEMEDPETEPSEIFEWWLISDYLANRLQQNGQVIWSDYGCTWWGRQTTGQAISMDHVISVIAEGMEILEGMPCSWEERK